MAVSDPPARAGERRPDRQALSGCRCSRRTQLGKSFGGLQALADVTLAIEPGEIYGLIGPNGAGKTTMFNLLTGLYKPTTGKVVFNGADVTGHKPHAIVEAGIARTFQNIRLFAHMTAVENVMVGRHLRTRAGALGRGLA